MMKLFFLTLVILLCGFSYLLGRSQAETKIVKEQIEVIKYVEQKKSQIYSQPDISRDTALELFRNNIL